MDEEMKHLEMATTTTDCIYNVHRWARGNYFGYPHSLTGLKKRQNSPKTVRILSNKGGRDRNVCPKYIPLLC